MAFMRRMEKYYVIIIILVFIVFVSLFYLPTLRSKTLLDTENENEKSLLDLIKSMSSNTYSYSTWPKYSTEWSSLTFDDTNGDYIKKLKCLNLNDGELMKISNLDEIIQRWKMSTENECASLYKKFLKIYDIKFKQSRVHVPKTFASKVQSWLGNNDELYKQVDSQELVFVYNRFTFEENVFNLLRGKRPQKVPQVKPDDYYKSLIEESEKTCDFCKYKDFTAMNEFGRFEKDYSFSAANIFPFNEHHSLFLPRKHDFMKITFNEFKELFYLPIDWFKHVHKSKSNYIYPILLWDFLPKGGASQVHPHLQCTINDDKYYGNFEMIRNGAENYYKATKSNYFTDFVKIHNSLGLTLSHKESVLVLPLTPKKDFDVTIMSENYNDSVIELIYAVIKTYIETLKIYPFSMSIYYPALAENQNGRIPLYVKIIPRGDISTASSEISSLELLSIFNSNKDQYVVHETFKTSLKSQLDKLQS